MTKTTRTTVTELFDDQGNLIERTTETEDTTEEYKDTPVPTNSNTSVEQLATNLANLVADSKSDLMSGSFAVNDGSIVITLKPWVVKDAQEVATLASKYLSQKVNRLW